MTIRQAASSFCIQRNLCLGEAIGTNFCFTWGRAEEGIFGKSLAPNRTSITLKGHLESSPLICVSTRMIYNYSHVRRLYLEKLKSRWAFFFYFCSQAAVSLLLLKPLRIWALGGVLGVKKVGRTLPRTREPASGVEKWVSGFPYFLARKKPEIRFSTPEVGLPGRKSTKRTQNAIHITAV